MWDDDNNDNSHCGGENNSGDAREDDVDDTDVNVFILVACRPKTAGTAALEERRRQLLNAKLRVHRVAERDRRKGHESAGGDRSGQQEMATRLTELATNHNPESGIEYVTHWKIPDIVMRRNRYVNHCMMA